MLAKIRLAQAGMQRRDTTITALCDEFGITKHTLYRCLAPDGKLREQEKRLVRSKK